MRRLVRGVSSGVLTFLAAALLCGCSGRPFGEVEGTVTVDGKPLPEAQVMFVPDGTKGNPGNAASAYTDEQGHYTLHSDRDGKDGTVLGLHRVVIIDMAAVPDLSIIGGAAGEAGQATKSSKPKTLRFLKGYTDLQLTPFKDIEIKPGKQTLDFDVKSGKR